MRHSRPTQAPDAHGCPVEVPSSGPAPTQKRSKQSDEADIRLHRVWCFVAIVELTLGILVDAFVLHPGAWHESWLFWVNLGMYVFPVGSVVVIKFNARAKQMVQAIMCIGTMLMGCFLFVYMDQAYGQYSQLQIQRIASGLRKYNFYVDSQVLLDVKPSDFVLFPSVVVLWTFLFLNAIQMSLFTSKGGPSSCVALVHLVHVAGIVTVLMCSQEAYDMWSIVVCLSMQIVYAIASTHENH